MSKRFWLEATDETWRALIEEPLPPTPPQLTRRKRFVAVATDRDDDVAAVLFARRGASGKPEAECSSLERQGGRWVWLGGGGGGDISLSPRVAATGSAYLTVPGAGWTRRPGQDSSEQHGVAHVTVLASAEVDEVAVSRPSGTERRKVPSHGWLLVVWRDERPLVSGYAASGECLVPNLFETPQARDSIAFPNHPPRWA